MRITTAQLRQIIKEEVEEVLMKEEGLDEGEIGKLEGLMHAGVIATWLAGIADAAYHQEPTAPVAHVLDAMYEVAKDMPEGEKINAYTYTKHVMNKLGDLVIPGEEEPAKNKPD